jgi:Family of unknown function (DUF6178)
MRKPVKRDRDPRDPGALIERILETPDLDRVIPQLLPDVLHRVVQACGLEESADVLALATPAQLVGVLDLDLWRADLPGHDDRFDADRFGVWLEVLEESGATIAAQTVAKMDAHLVGAAIAHHARVADVAAGVSTPDHALSCVIGGYRVVAKHADSWNAIVAMLASLSADHHDCFHRVMRACRGLSNSAPEVDGLDDLLTRGKQAMFDLAFDRERRREKQGYTTPPQARAFLHMSRQLQLGHDTPPPANAVAGAYFRAIDRRPIVTGEHDGASRLVVDALFEAGVLPQPARALLEGPRDQAPRLARMQAHMAFTRGRDHEAFAKRSDELAYLANTLAAGCSIQARAFTPQEASDAAVAVCNLGLENWPPRWIPAEAGASSDTGDTGLPDDFLISQDLVAVFQVGWTSLHANVCMYSAERLIEVLSELLCTDVEIQSGLGGLRTELVGHWRAGAPWRARDAMDVLTTLDMPAWAALVGLLDECPVIHGGLGASLGPTTRAVSATAFEFISENSQIASVRAFMRSLPGILRG